MFPRGHLCSDIFSRLKYLLQASKKAGRLKMAYVSHHDKFHTIICLRSTAHYQYRGLISSRIFAQFKKKLFLYIVYIYQIFNLKLRKGLILRYYPILIRGKKLLNEKINLRNYIWHFLIFQLCYIIWRILYSCNHLFIETKDGRKK